MRRVTPEQATTTTRWTRKRAKKGEAVLFLFLLQVFSFRFYLLWAASGVDLEGRLIDELGGDDRRAIIVKLSLCLSLNSKHHTKSTRLARRSITNLSNHISTPLKKKNVCLPRNTVVKSYSQIKSQ